ncbi:hypothetical protein FDECE_14813 [Fusarium decemcellulare]|nr:hypothetical protein FDECE_14813 [Fusarium decemcellulare]
MNDQHAPLTGIRVLEFAGLAPGPFAGMLCADWGAEVLRVDPPHLPGSLGSKDLLARRKSSIQVDLKDPGGSKLIRELVKNIDVIIDPFRPGVLEKLGLDPEELTALNPRLIIARMTGFRRDGKYRNMAGHDINYIAVSGVLSMLGVRGSPPAPPMNLLGDFAGGGLVCFLGIILSLFSRTKTGLGQLVEANMVDGSAFIATSPRLNMKTSLWDGERGTNLLDGGCPYYATYETKDGGYMAIGSLEPQFFAVLAAKLAPYGLSISDSRDDRALWPNIRQQLERIFKLKSRAEWELTFDGTDACVTPVLTQQELEASGYEQRPAVTLSGSPALPIAIKQATQDTSDGKNAGVPGEGWEARPMKPGHAGDKLLRDWMNWKRGSDFYQKNSGIVIGSGSPTKL